MYKFIEDVNPSINLSPSIAFDPNAIGEKACKLILRGCPKAIQPGLPETIQDCKSCCLIDIRQLAKTFKTKCKNRCLKACDSTAASLELDPTAVSREENNK